MCSDGLQQFNNNIDARNEFSDPKNLLKDISHGYISKFIFSTVLAASGGLNITLGGHHYTKPLEHGIAEIDSSTQKKNKNEMIYHMRVCSKNHLEAVFEAELASGGLRFGIC